MAIISPSDIVRSVMNQACTDEMPGPVLRRLPRYLTHVRELNKVGQEWVSSREIAQTLGLTMSTVRQDISHLDLVGVSKRGYEVSKLERVLSETLGAGSIHQTVIVGAGLLGRALALHADFEESGFVTCAIFDAAPHIVGTSVGPLVVKPMTELQSITQEFNVDIGVIAVPADAAQSVADQLVGTGILGILNLAHSHLHVPKHVYMVEARIIARMQEIAYAIRAGRMPAAKYSSS